MKNLIALTLLIVVLANNVNCDRAPPVRAPPVRVPPARVPINGQARPPVNSPNIVIPTRSNGSPTRQTMPITRAPPTRTTLSGTAPSPTRA